ncbi:MAG TPA: hypothetical protein VFS20_21230, partial [Longimicrobium sp.]|nr:hypothetical protein [Longimicrobium sp.]
MRKFLLDVSSTMLCGTVRDTAHDREKEGSSRISLPQVTRSRTDAVDEWLQAALALSIEIFLERHPRAVLPSRKARLSQRIDRGARGEPGRRARPSHRCW